MRATLGDRRRAQRKKKLRNARKAKKLRAERQRIPGRTRKPPPPKSQESLTRERERRGVDKVDLAVRMFLKELGYL